VIGLQSWQSVILDEMKPFLVGQTLWISGAVTLAPHVQESPTLLSLDHLAHAGKNVVIRTVYVTTHARTQSFFYALDGLPLLWPHAAIEDHELGRRLTVNQAKPMEACAPRSKTNQEQPPSPQPSRITTVHAETAAASGINPKLYVGGLPYDMTDTGLFGLFRRFGNIEATHLIMDPMTGRSRGFGFVKFRDVTSATNAVVTLGRNAVTGTGELASVYQTEEYLAWLRRSWDVTPAGIREYGDEHDGGTRIMAILEESSRGLAQCVADYPHTLASIEWRDFERMLAVIFEGLGFGVTCGRGSKDGGVDLRLTTPSSTYVVQAKHWVSGKKVGGSTLQATVTVAMLEGQSGAIVLSTSGFTRNAVTAVTSLQRTRLRIGERWQIHSLCRTYVSFDHGLLQPLDPEAVLRANTRSL
jgi:hypothetical protein